MYKKLNILFTIIFVVFVIPSTVLSHAEFAFKQFKSLASNSKYAYFSDDGKNLAVLQENNLVQVFSYPDGKEKYDFKLAPENSLFAYSPDGKKIAYTVNNKLFVRDLEKKKFLLAEELFQYIPSGLTFSPDNRNIAVTSYHTKLPVKIKIIEIEQGKTLKTITTEIIKPFTSIAFSKNNRYLATSGADTKVYLWNPSKGKLEKEFELGKHTGGLAISNDSDWLAVGLEDFSFAVIEIKSGENVLTAKSKDIRDNLGNNIPNLLAFDRNKEFLFIGNKNIDIWSLKSKELLETLIDISRVANSIDIHPTGKSLIIGSNHINTKYIKHWDLEFLDTKKRVYENFKKEIDEFGQKRDYETEEAYENRLSNIDDQFNMIVVDVFEELNSVIKLDTILRVKNQKNNIFSLTFPSFQEITFDQGEPLFKAVQKDLKSLKLTNIDVTWEPRFHRSTTWKVNQAIFTHPLIKKPIIFSQQPKLASNSTNFPNLTTKFKEALKRAESKKAQDELNLAILYVLGEGTEKNKESAQKYLKQSLEQNDPLAKYYNLHLENEENSSKNSDILATLLSKNKERYSDDLAYAIGDIYLHGKFGINKNLNDAKEWFKKAANRNHRAQKELAYIYIKEKDKDKEKTFRFMRSAAYYGDFEAQYELANFYRTGFGTKKDAVEAVKLYQQSAEQNYAPAMLKLALMLEKGNGVEMDPITSLEFYKKAAKEGNSEAKLIVGIKTKNKELLQEIENEGNIKATLEIAKILEEENSSAKKIVAAYTKAAELGNVEAELWLGKYYFNDRTLISNLDNAKKWLEKATEKNNAEAQFLLATYYELTSVNNENKDKAFQLYLTSAENNFSKAQIKLGNYYQNLEIPDLKKAEMWFTRAKKRNMEATLLLAKLYLKTPGKRNDGLELYNTYAESSENPNVWIDCANIFLEKKPILEHKKIAYRWLTKAYNQGVNVSNILGNLYTNDPDFSKESKDVYFWHKKSADNGNSESQYIIGELLLNSDDPEAKKEGLEWIKKSANNNSEKAKEMLGLLYLNGEILQQNDIKAMMYLLNSENSNVKELDKRLGLLYLIKLIEKNKTPFDDNTEARSLSERGINGYVNGLKNIGEKQVEDAIAIAPKQFYAENFWLTLVENKMPLSLASLYFTKLYKSMKSLPDFWILYSHVAVQAGQPELALKGIKQLTMILTNLDEAERHDILQISKIIEASALVLSGERQKALESLYAYGKFDKTNESLINFINKWGHPLLGDKEKLAFVTGIELSKITAMPLYLRPQSFHDVISGELINPREEKQEDIPDQKEIIAE